MTRNIKLFKKPKRFFLMCRLKKSSWFDVGNRENFILGKYSTQKKADSAFKKYRQDSDWYKNYDLWIKLK